jgi:hypothetical protein
MIADAIPIFLYKVAGITRFQPKSTDNQSRAGLIGPFIAVLINMFKFGYNFYVIRRNNAIPSAHGGISASIISEQPQWI